MFSSDCLCHEAQAGLGVMAVMRGGQLAGSAAHRALLCALWRPASSVSSASSVCSPASALSPAFTWVSQEHAAAAITPAITLGFHRSMLQLP